jgi:hypothetical protein
LTTPVIAPCAKAAAGRSNSDDTSTSDRATTLEGIRFLLGTPRPDRPDQRSAAARRQGRRGSVTRQPTEYLHLGMRSENAPFGDR